MRKYFLMSRLRMTVGAGDRFWPDPADDVIYSTSPAAAKDFARPSCRGMTSLPSAHSEAPNVEVIMNTQTASNSSDRPVWNKGKLVGQKSQLRLSEIWAIRVRQEIYERVRDLALFNLAIDSKLRGCEA